MLDGSNSFEPANGNFLNAPPGPGQPTSQQSEKGAENVSVGLQNDLMRKPYGAYDQRHDPGSENLAPNKYPASGQHNQPVSNGPQYITNIYNTINTHSITTHQDQIYQFMGPTPYSGQPQAMQMHPSSSNGNPSLSTPLSQLQPSMQAPVDLGPGQGQN